MSWLTEEASSVSPTDSWVYMCSSFSSSVTTVVSNNWEITKNGARPNDKIFGSFGVNIYIWGERSDFGIAEVIVWNRALTRSELFSMQRYLASKYGFPSRGDEAISQPMRVSM